MQEGQRLTDIVASDPFVTPQVDAIQHDEETDEVAIPIEHYRTVAIDTDPTKRLIHFVRDHLRFSTPYKSYPENIIRQTEHAKRQKQSRRQKLIVQPLVMLVALVTAFQSFVPLGAIKSFLTRPITSQTSIALQDLQQGQKLLDQKQYSQAADSFHRASVAFQQSKLTLKQAGQDSLIQGAITPDTVSEAGAILTAADDLANAAIVMAQLLDSSQGLLKTPAPVSTDIVSTNPLDKMSNMLTQYLSQSDTYSAQSGKISQYIDDAVSVMQANASQPSSQPDLEKARQLLWQKLPTLHSASNSLALLTQGLPALLGSDINRRYLVLFLNNSELRPGGGFIGSFATTVVSKGHIDDFNINTNIYKQDNAFTQATHVDPPTQLLQLTPDWAMRDSNFDVDFTAGAKTTAQFYQQEGGAKVDGVIGIDTTMIISLLQKTGPIFLPSRNITITADNFLQTVQYEVEQRYLTDPAIKALNEPKMVLAELFPLFLEKVFKVAQEDPGAIGSVMSEMVSQKHLQMAAFFDQGQKTIQAFNLDNPIPSQGDFLMVNNANIGGLKSSLHIDENVNVSIEPTPQQTLMHTITITRKHNGSYGWPDGDNHNFIRIVIPRDAHYIDGTSDGQEYTIPNTADVQIFDHWQTVGFWATTAVGKQTTITFRYETPITYDLLGKTDYEFNYMKQPGWTGDNLTVDFKNSNFGNFLMDNHTYTNYQQTHAYWKIPLEK